MWCGVVVGSFQQWRKSSISEVRMPLAVFTTVFQRGSVTWTIGACNVWNIYINIAYLTRSSRVYRLAYR